MNKYQEALDYLETMTRGKINNTEQYHNDKSSTLAIANLQELINNYHTLKNEMCLLCGKYKNEHLGACKDCRWHDGK